MAEATETVESNGIHTSSTSEPESRRSFFQLHPAAKWALLVIGLLVVLGGIFAWRYYSTHESTDDAQIDGDMYPISARINGHVVAVEVQNNQFVRKGTVLVRIDPTDYQVALERAQADYAMAMARAQASRVGVPITSVNSSTGISSAQARVEEAQAAIAAAEKQSLAAEAKVKQSQADYAKAKSDLDRYAQLIKKDEISQQQYDHALQSAEADSAAVVAAQSAAAATAQNVALAQAQLAQARADLNASKTGPQRVRVSRAEADAAEAAVKTAKAVLDQAQLNVDYCIVRAPADGIVGKKAVEVGQNIGIGQAVMAIVPVEGLYVTANYKETELKDMRPGDPATIHVDAYDRDYKGHVLNIAGATGEKFSLLPPENATGNYVKVVQRVPVRIVFDPGQDSEHLLRVGMSVEPTVTTKK
ncbi:MAG: HlyD family secretion protein [Acidobacteria bacterium]|nr:MAG: HlyD family secretion protein [Acidobacteriota bacterium]